MPTDRLFDHTIRLRGARMAIVAFLLGAVRAYPLEAQQPAATQPPAPTTAASSLASYRPPALVLAQPAAGSPLAQDRPVAVFRFAQGEPNDPLDLASFAVSVDGHNRTSQFQLTTVPHGEAWGSLADTRDPSDALAVGTYQVAARMCSVRGACATINETITIVPPPVTPRADDDKPQSRKRRVLGAIVTAGRKLLGGL